MFVAAGGRWWKKPPDGDAPPLALRRFRAAAFVVGLAVAVLALVARLVFIEIGVFLRLDRGQAGGGATRTGR